MDIEKYINFLTQDPVAQEQLRKVLPAQILFMGNTPAIVDEKLPDDDLEFYYAGFKILEEQIENSIGNDRKLLLPQIVLFLKKLCNAIYEVNVDDSSISEFIFIMRNFTKYRRHPVDYKNLTLQGFVVYVTTFVSGYYYDEYYFDNDYSEIMNKIGDKFKLLSTKVRFRGMFSLT